MNHLEKKHKVLKIPPHSLGWLGALASGISLILYCYLGTFSRFYADDFCMSGYVIRLGFWRAQWFQYVTWSNRFTGMFLVSVSDLFGTSFIKWWTSLTVILWVIGLAWALLKISKLLHMQMPRWMALLITEWIILFSILLAPQVYQSLFWRIGLITYTVPLFFLCFLIGIMIQGYLDFQNNKKAWGWVVLGGFIAFLGGGLSETYLALQITFLGLALLMLLMVNNKEKLKSGSKPIGGALIGSLLSMVIVLSAPGNAVRQAAISVHPAFLEFFKMVITNTFLFIYISMKNNAFQMLLAGLAPLIFAYFGGIRMSPTTRPSSIIFVALVSPIILYITLAAVMAPAAFAQSSYPDGRVLMDASFPIVIFLGVEGFLFGMILNQLHDLAGEPIPAKLQILSAMFVLIMILYPLYDAYKSFRSIPEYQAYATAWDARNARIAAATLIGLDQVVESTLDAPGQLADISTDPNNWVNNCVAQFYGLSSISAMP